jgi:hypothetical protein
VGAAVVGAVVAVAAALFALALSELTGDAEREVNRRAVEPPPPAAAEAADGIPRWPAGLRAYTVVLREVRGRSSAERRARQALRAGLEAGVARTDDFTSLRGGRWIAFAGRFQSLIEAQTAADTYATRGFPGGEPRLLAPAR